MPSPEQDREPRARQAIRSRDVTDGEIYEDLEYQRPDQPGIVEIVELDNANSDHIMGEGDINDPDYEPDDTSSRSRGNAIRKRKPAKEKEKRTRSKSRGRRTRSQTVQEKEILANWNWPAYYTIEADLWSLDNFRQRLGLLRCF